MKTKNLQMVMAEYIGDKSIIQVCIAATVIAGMLGIYSCSDDNMVNAQNDNEEIEVEKVIIDPQNATFGVGEEFEFSAFLISATGDTVNDEFEVEWNWFSSDPNVFSVENGGIASGHNEGEAHCIVEASTISNKIVAKMRFVGRDSALVTLLN